MNQDVMNKLSDFAMIFIGLLIESIPFVVLGVLISALVAKYIKSNFILKFRSKNRFLSHIQAMFIGLALPVCECGNVPLAKRLSIVGFKPSEVITFFLAAPILNPLVLFTTLEAFNLDKNIAIIRILSGAAIALIVGIVFSYHPNQRELMQNSAQSIRSFDGFSASKNEEAIDHNNFLETFRDEFFNVFKMLAIGCAIAALFQIVVPRQFTEIFASEPTLSIIAMMVLAFIISICSSVDAFFALSLSATFSLGSILAFLVFGPMIDIKTLTMLRSVFKPKALGLLTAMVGILCVFLGIAVNNLYKLNY
jgi:uncharacterized protein